MAILGSVFLVIGVYLILSRDIYIDSYGKEA